ncbi:MAG: DUF2330 domain-containing protein [Sandaracinaceae bacterium]|nr:DUF2330 domain-containing protein [Sandaracinaceae bacterium]
MRTSLTALVLALSLAPATASAFCGFYVASGDAELFNHATTVVMLRHGSTTVLAMQNDYQGPPEDFAMVVPVPTVLHAENVKTLERSLFERVDQLASPRLVEYWEQDPCDPNTGLGSGSGYGRGAGGLRGRAASGGGIATVVVEAEFAVGEYDVVVLSAGDSTGLDAWLRAHDYRIPEGAEPVLRPYVESGMKFFVARVDPDRVTFESGRARLSPLRFHYTSEEFSLPVRLGLLNSAGTQDLIVHILADGQRYEVANYDNVTIPTNLAVDDAVRERFGEFYAALFDATVAHHPGAVVTEYAWQASNCDPCPGPVLGARDIASLGADVTHPGVEVPVPIPFAMVRTPTSEATGGIPREVIRRAIRRRFMDVRRCYEAGLARDPDLEGRLTVSLDLAGDGHVTRASADEASTLADDRVRECVVGVLQGIAFPAAEDGSPTTARYPFDFSREVVSGTFGGGPFDGFVLTRLHYRYGRDDLGEDLVFRAAEPIVGGREWYAAGGEELEQGAAPAPLNNFQGRYIIRHAWTGAIECEEPQRGIWGGPIEGAAPVAVAATDLASARRGHLELATTLRQPLPALGVDEVRDPPPPEPEPEVAEPVVVQEATPAEASEVAPTSDGCGCRAAGPMRSGSALAGLVALCLLARRRRWVP